MWTLTGLHHILSDLLALFQSREGGPGVDYAKHICLSPPKTFRRPCWSHTNIMYAATVGNLFVLIIHLVMNASFSLCKCNCRGRPLFKLTRAPHVSANRSCLFLLPQTCPQLCTRRCRGGRCREHLDSRTHQLDGQLRHHLLHLFIIFVSSILRI